MTDEMTMSRGLLEDFKRFAVQADRERIINALDLILEQRKQARLNAARPISNSIFIDEVIKIVNGE
jgi:hypothetical protein